MARKPIKKRPEPEPGETGEHEAKETRAYEKAEKEDKALHKVVTKAMKKVSKR